MLFVGIDPDLRDTGIAVLNQYGDMVAGTVVCARGARKEAQVLLMAEKLRWACREVMLAQHDTEAMVVVESQTVAMHHTKNPGSIVLLAQVAGAAVVSAQETWTVRRTWLPRPNEWKGSVPKLVHQKRIARKMRWAATERSGYVVPVDPPVKLSKLSGWKHLMDAVGLALWAKEQFIKAE